MAEDKEVLPQDLKQLLMSFFDKEKAYIGSEIKHKIQCADFTILRKPLNPPNRIKVGDVITFRDGAKKRPCVILKVLKDRSCIYTTLSSTENVHNLMPHNSRFFKEGFICKTLSLCTEETALANFVGVFDDPKFIRTATKAIKQFYIDNL